MRREKASGIALAAVLTAAALMFFSGCGAKLQETDVPYAGPMLDTILDGIADGDYARFSRDFSAKMKAAVAEEGFFSTVAELNEKLGGYVERSFSSATKIRNAAMDLTAVVYRAKYSKEGGVTITMYIADDEGEKTVEGFSVDSPSLQK